MEERRRAGLRRATSEELEEDGDRDGSWASEGGGNEVSVLVRGSDRASYSSLGDVLGAKSPL